MPFFGIVVLHTLEFKVYRCVFELEFLKLVHQLYVCVWAHKHTQSSSWQRSYNDGKFFKFKESMSIALKGIRYECFIRKVEHAMLHIERLQTKTIYSHNVAF